MRKGKRFSNMDRKKEKDSDIGIGKRKKIQIKESGKGKKIQVFESGKKRKDIGGK